MASISATAAQGNIWTLSQRGGQEPQHHTIGLHRRHPSQEQQVVVGDTGTLARQLLPPGVDRMVLRGRFDCSAKVLDGVDFEIHHERDSSLDYLGL